MTGDFESLIPESILTSVEAAKLFTTGEIRQLNSYENRVFEIPLEVTPLSAVEDKSVIVKFYRPKRWDRAAIKAEHNFIDDLNDHGMPAVGPFKLYSEDSILEHDGFLVSIFPKIRGRMPQEFLEGDLRQVGRRLALLHNVGSQSVAEDRLDFDAEEYGWKSLERLRQWIEPSLIHDYVQVAEEILESIEEDLEQENYLRIHGDCHRGNLLQIEKEFFFVDFDDFCNGPAVQDLWMLALGEDKEKDLDELLEGYTELRSFDNASLSLIPGLQGLRIIMYAGWIAARWHDPFFKQIFPQFTSYNYWADELAALRTCAQNL